MEKVKSKKEAKEEKLKEQKIEEQMLKILEDAKLKTPEEKLQFLLGKYVENERNNRRLTQEAKVHERQLESIMREKDNLQREYNKNLLMRDKLTEVCREQQKLIKSVKNESMQKIREEEEKRKESQSKFQTSLNEITVSLNKNNEENNKLRDHNIEMTKKLKFLAEQYQVREQQLEKLNEQVQLESQLHQAKLSKVQMESAMEKEILIKEKQIALENLMQTQKMLKELSEREQALKEQLHLYTAKYDDFQSSLQKSNDIFATYKIELEKMSKNTRKLEKESAEWKRKWEKSNATLIELATEKKDRDEHARRCNKQVEQLQKLLRALQNERTHLYKVIKENNIELPSLPPLPPEPEPLKVTPISNAADKDKMEVMSSNCAELKMTLANLQNQMKYLNLKGAEAEQQCRQLQAQEESIKKKQKKKPKIRKAAAVTTASAKTNANNNTENINAIEKYEQAAIEVAPPVMSDPPITSDVSILPVAPVIPAAPVISSAPLVSAASAEPAAPGVSVAPDVPAAPAVLAAPVVVLAEPSVTDFANNAESSPSSLIEVAETIITATTIKRTTPEPIAVALKEGEILHDDGPLGTVQNIEKSIENSMEAM